MKNFIKSFVALLMMSFTTFCFTACGNGGEGGTFDVSGNTYAFDSCTVDGDDATKTLTSMCSEYNFYFKEDGTCVQTMVWADAFAEILGSSDSEELIGTYEQNGNIVTVTVTYDGVEAETVMEFIVGKDRITLMEDNSITVWKLKEKIS